MSQIVTVGTRGSALALCQSELVVAELKKSHPQLQFKIKVIKTTGDKLLKTPFIQMVGKGFFTKEIEEALIAKKIDFAVHSLKDLPSEMPESLTLAAIPKREDPRDALISSGGEKLEELPRKARVGTSSPRRQAWLKSLRPDLTLVPLRGNLNTRLDKVLKKESFKEEVQVDAIVLALAGLKRLKMDHLVTEVLSPESFLPAPGQGFLAVQARKEDKFILNLLSSLNDATSLPRAVAEREFLAAWGGGCSIPLGAYAELDGTQLRLRAKVYLEKEARVIAGEEVGTAQEAKKVARILTERLKQK